MSNKYLLEVGTEELPYKFIPQAIEQLKQGFENFFKTNNIEFNSVAVYATPRRLAVIVNDLADKQPDEVKILKGPIEKVAYDENGNLSKAGQGFAGKCGVNPSDLFIKDGYLHAKVFNQGKLTSELLFENVSALILKLQGPHFMRWGVNEEKFSRPIRWIVSLLNDKEIPIEIVNVKSSRYTRGHRFNNDSHISAENDVEISNPDEYIKKLKKAHVYVDQNERKALIVDLAKKEADKLGALAYYDEDLLEEVTYLCEYPVPVVCDFDKKYLDIPEKVTVTVMVCHQRYFALYKDGKLINKFITIANYLGNDFTNVKAGNERVIVARLDDAIFFFKEDTKKKFDTYIEELKGVTFQKGLGSVFNKVQRIKDLSEQIAVNLNQQASLKTILRTAELCKADLTTSLVFEFTELQGFIGSDYAKISGEDYKVVKGIKEHYFPLNADSELAEGIEGQIVGIADKIDTICAVFFGGKIPTGSSDPLGVRRAALGVIKTILDKKLKINLNDLIKLALEQLRLPLDSEVLAKVKEFFVQRVIIFLSDNYRKDVLEACSTTSKNPLEDLCDFVERVEFVSSLLNKNEFLSVLESANRITRIIKENVDKDIKLDLFVLEAEKSLYDGVKTIDETSYKALYDSFIKVNPLIEKFFEDVLVMDKNEEIKNNRLAMLTCLKKKYEIIANFSALQI